jgi:hypothetical protein
MFSDMMFRKSVGIFLKPAEKSLRQYTKYLFKQCLEGISKVMTTFIPFFHFPLLSAGSGMSQM